MAMNLSAPFVRRPIATTLMAAGLALFGALAFMLLPVAPLPEVDFPTASCAACSSATRFVNGTSGGFPGTVRWWSWPITRSAVRRD